MVGAVGADAPRLAQYTLSDVEVRPILEPGIRFHVWLPPDTVMVVDKSCSINKTRMSPLAVLAGRFSDTPDVVPVVTAPMDTKVGSAMDQTERSRYSTKVTPALAVMADEPTSVSIRN